MTRSVILLPRWARALIMQRIIRAHILLNRHNLLVVSCVAAVWLVLLFVVRRSSREVTKLLLVYGEVLLPALLGSMATGILLNDPCRELLLVAPYKLWKVVVGRLAVLIVGTALVWLLLVGIALVLQPQLETPVVQVLLGGISTFSAFAGLGLFTSLLFRSAIGGGMCIGAVWASALLFRESLLANPIGLLLHPFLTLQAPESLVWTINRLALSGITLILLLLSLPRLHQDETLLPREERREEL
jgi:ABC-type transport system involved in multi-copper enzyme maturation permease subunit